MVFPFLCRLFRGGGEGAEFTKEFIKGKAFIKELSSDYSYDEAKTAENGSAKKFIKEGHKEFIKEKAFIKASRLIYRLVALNPKITATQMAETMKMTPRQVLKYIQQLKETQKIARVGGRKMGYWKITDEEYDSFFDRI